MMFMYVHYNICYVEIPLPNEQARLDILKIHAAPITKMGEVGKLYTINHVQSCYLNIV